jgi:hypothetical protein
MKPVKRSFLQAKEKLFFNEENHKAIDYLTAIVRYYAYGFLFAITPIFIIFLIGGQFDQFYLIYDVLLFFKVTFIMAMPSGIHLFIMKYIDQPQQTKNPYLRRFYTIFASYWLGFIFSLLLLFLLQVLSNFILIPYSYYLTDENLLAGSLVVAIPKGVVVYYFIF